jgi:ABC-type Fe3+/spermidine/putrescine transport system ATPase subunit
MLKIDNLQFGHGLHIVGAEDTALGTGIYGVIGPSGSGKSTFLNTLAGFHNCEFGSVIFDGQDLLTQRVEDRPIAMLFQSKQPFPAPVDFSQCRAWDHIAALAFKQSA